MSDTNQKPVIFLAFANDRDDTVRYLRNLPEEARQIRQPLQRARRDGLCELVELANATADSCDLDEGTSADCNASGIPDECEVAAGGDCNSNLVLDVCDYIYVLDFGSLIAEGTPADIRANAAVIEAYLGQGASA